MLWPVRLVGRWEWINFEHFVPTRQPRGHHCVEFDSFTTLWSFDINANMKFAWTDEARWRDDIVIVEQTPTCFYFVSIMCSAVWLIKTFICPLSTFASSESLFFREMLSRSWSLHTQSVERMWNETFCSLGIATNLSCNMTKKTTKNNTTLRQFSLVSQLSLLLVPVGCCVVFVVVPVLK